jgi:ATP-dependent DNA helicase RecG
MKIMVSTANGFIIAEKDLAMRGPGNLSGTQQSGVLKFKIADIVADSAILEQTRIAAQQIISEDPGLTSAQYYPLRAMLAEKSHQSHWAKIS